jgi:dephospho-CoA kinase
MLRVGLTGDLGSGKSTVAAMLAKRGAVVLSSDETGRAIMQPGEAAFDAIVQRFGDEVLAANGLLDRRKLAALAFDPVAPRVAELNAIIHPAVIAEQAQQMQAFVGTDAIVVVESALIFTAYGQTEEQIRERFDRVLLVVAPEAVKIARFVERALDGHPGSAEERTALEDDARRRLAMQRAEEHADACRVIRSEGNVEELEAEVEIVWGELVRLAATLPASVGGVPPPTFLA